MSRSPVGEYINDQEAEVASDPLFLWFGLVGSLSGSDKVGIHRTVRRSAALWNINQVWGWTSQYFLTKA